MAHKEGTLDEHASFSVGTLAGYTIGAKVN